MCECSFLKTWTPDLYHLHFTSTYICGVTIASRVCDDFFLMLEHTCNINCFYIYQEFSFSGMNFFGVGEASHVSPRKMWPPFQQNKVVFQIIRLRFANAFNTIEIWDPGPCLFMSYFLFIFFPIILALQFLRKPCFCRVAYAHDDHTILFGSRIVFLIDDTFHFCRKILSYS